MWIPYTDAVVVVRCNPLELHDKLESQPTKVLCHCTYVSKYELGLDVSRVVDVRRRRKYHVLPQSEQLTTIVGVHLSVGG